MPRLCERWCSGPAAELVLVGALLGLVVLPFIALHGPQGPNSAQSIDLILVLDAGSARLDQAERFR